MRLLGVMLAVTLLAACASDSPAPVESRMPQARPVPSAATAKAPAVAAAIPQSYIVRKGDALAAIAFRFGLDMRNLARWNDLRDPNRIYPGQRLLLHDRGAVASAAAPSAVAGNPQHASAPEVVVEVPRQVSPSNAAGTTVSAVATAKPSTQGEVKDPEPVVTSGRWLWPADGEVTPAVSALGTKGIRILGNRGQTIAAVADGEVVYSGSGLRGYGNLIIIRHDAEYLSAYAHNEKVLVHEGDKVKAGQKIAEMGDSGAQQVMLHFELRVNGIAVDPLRYLPRRTAARG